MSSGKPLTVTGELRIAASPVLAAGLALGRFLRDCPDLLTDEALAERGRLNKALLDAVRTYDVLREETRAR